MIGHLQRFIEDRRGVAAIEFALVLTAMLVMLTGLVEISNLMMAERRVSGAAHAVADLISQETDVNSTELSEIVQASRLIIEPLDDTDLTVGVASVRFDDTTGDPSEDWTYSYNGGAVSNSTTQASGLGAEGESVIIVTATFSYTPVLSSILAGTFTLSETAIVRPRYLDYVGYY